MNDEAEVKQSNFSGWGIVEMMGHRKEIGYITTQAFGPAVLFQVDTPELPDREYALTAPGYAGDRWCPAGTKVKRPATPARTCLVAPGSLYAMTPCTEEAARAAIEHAMARPLIILELPANMALAAPVDEDQDGDEDEDDDIYNMAAT